MSADKNKWLLPDGIEELLPEQAKLLEQSRRLVLNAFSVNGYQLVQPPLLEFLDSLLSGAGNDLDLLTFKVTDQYSGRMMGIRADMTPQLSRIDAHVLNKIGPSRLCYLGSVLQTADRSGFHSREPIQFGAELFGHSGPQADVEIIRLCVDVLKALGIDSVCIDLGHVGIFRALVHQAGFNEQQSTDILNICLRKSWPDLQAFVDAHRVDEQISQIFAGLLTLEGTAEQIFPKAITLLEDCDENVKSQLNDFQSLVQLLSEYLPEIECTIDFLELRGINYHTGVVFSVYSHQYAHAIAKGGRYDDIGQAFGRARPATGFSADLRQCLNFSKLKTESANGIYAPFDTDKELKTLVQQLRDQGEQVIIGLEQEELQTCDREIIKQDGRWKIIDRNS